MPALLPENRLRTAFVPCLTLGFTLLLTGCATGLGSDWTSAWVSSYGNWPGGRAPGSYVFDRLPSQQMAEQQMTGAPSIPVLDARGRVQRDQNSASLTPIEQSAQAALSRKGFFPAPVGSTPSVLVQISQSIERDVQPNPPQVDWDSSSYSDRHRHHRRRDSGLSWAITASSDDDRYDRHDRYDASPRWRPPSYRVSYQRQLSVVLRDAATNQALYEARVREPEARSDAPALIEGLFRAALDRFPLASPQAQHVMVSDQPVPPPPLK